MVHYLVPPLLSVGGGHFPLAFLSGQIKDVLWLLFISQPVNSFSIFRKERHRENMFLIKNKRVLDFASNRALAKALSLDAGDRGFKPCIIAFAPIQPIRLLC